MTVADEGPPDDEVFTQRLAADDDRPDDLAGIRVSLQPQPAASGCEIAECTCRHLGVVHLDRAGVGEYPELPVLGDLDLQGVCGGEPDLRGAQRRVDLNG